MGKQGYTLKAVSIYRHYTNPPVLSRPKVGHLLQKAHYDFDPQWH